MRNHTFDFLNLLSAMHRVAVRNINVIPKMNQVVDDGIMRGKFLSRRIGDKFESPRQIIPCVELHKTIGGDIDTRYITVMRIRIIRSSWGNEAVVYTYLIDVSLGR